VRFLIFLNKPTLPSKVRIGKKLRNLVDEVDSYLADANVDYIRNYSPYAIKNRAFRENSYVYVGHNDVMEMALLLVREEQIRHPDATSLRQG